MHDGRLGVLVEVAVERRLNIEWSDSVGIEKGVCRCVRRLAPQAIAVHRRGSRDGDRCAGSRRVVRWGRRGQEHTEDVAEEPPAAVLRRESVRPEFVRERAPAERDGGASIPWPTARVDVAHGGVVEGEGGLVREQRGRLALTRQVAQQRDAQRGD